jgi:rhamnulokinase
MNETAVLTKEAEQAGFTNEVAADGSSLLIRNLSGTWLLEECLRIWVVADAGANGSSKVDTSTDTSSLRTHLLVAAESKSARVEGIFDCGAPELIGTRDMPTEIVDLYRRNHENIELTRAQVVRLILESLAESFARTIARAKEITGTPFREIIMIGGGSRIEQLVALTEQATDLPVRVGHPEATSIGNICVQAVSAGVFDTMDQARAVTHAQQKEN